MRHQSGGGWGGDNKEEKEKKIGSYLRFETFSLLSRWKQPAVDHVLGITALSRTNQTLTLSVALSSNCIVCSIQSACTLNPLTTVDLILSWIW